MDRWFEVIAKPFSTTNHATSWRAAGDVRPYHHVDRCAVVGGDVLGAPQSQIKGFAITSEGWLVVADADLTKPWDEKIGREEVIWQGKSVHVVRC